MAVNSVLGSVPPCQKWVYFCHCSTLLEYNFTEIVDEGAFGFDLLCYQNGLSLDF